MVLGQAAKIFTRLKYTITIEPHYQTSVGLRKPDMLISGEDKPSVIINATITSDMYSDPNTPHYQKVK